MAIDLYLRAFLSLGIVLGLVLGCAWLLRRYGAAGLATRTRNRRLDIAETLMLDARHRLILVRRDATQHLVLLGPHGMLLVEAGIGAVPVAGEFAQHLAGSS